MIAALEHIGNVLHRVLAEAQAHAPAAARAGLDELPPEEAAANAAAVDAQFAGMDPGHIKTRAARLSARIIAPDGAVLVRLHDLRAPRGRRFTEEGVLRYLRAAENALRARLPHAVWRVVCTGPGSFNIVIERFGPRAQA